MPRTERSQVFAPDLRNLGGRTEVIEEKKAHTKLLATMKPQIDSSRPKTMALSRNLSANRASRQRSGAEMDVLREQRETYRRVVAVSTGQTDRKGTNTNYPSTYFRAKAVSRNKKCRSNYEDEMHRKRMANMQRRIASYDSVTEKKKNIYNAEVYPSLIMRREILDNTGVPFSAKQKTPRQRSTPRPSSARGPTRPSEETGATSRPQSARSSGSHFRGTDPAISMDAGDDYERFRQGLLDTIINDRIYRAKDLRSLFDNHLENAPSHLNRVKLERIVDGLRSVFLDPE